MIVDFGGDGGAANSNDFDVVVDSVVDLVVDLVVDWALDNEDCSGCGNCPAGD